MQWKLFHYEYFDLGWSLLWHLDDDNADDDSIKGNIDYHANDDDNNGANDDNDNNHKITASTNMNYKIGNALSNADRSYIVLVLHVMGISHACLR